MEPVLHAALIIRWHSLAASRGCLIMHITHIRKVHSKGQEREQLLTSRGEKKGGLVEFRPCSSFEDLQKDTQGK